MSKLQFITHQTTEVSHLEAALMALKGGCKWIQLRMKGATREPIELVAISVKSLCEQYNAVLILNDHVELVKKLNLDGVHLGNNDMPITEARALLGHSFIIGATANSFKDILQKEREGANYIGLGPFRYTTTKNNLSPLLGLSKIKEIMEQMSAVNCSIPVVAIGGIVVDDLSSLLETGIDGVAVSGAIVRAKDPIETTRRIVTY